MPPTPGPLIIAGTLNIDLGIMIMIGLAVAIPTAVIMLFFVRWLSSKIDIPMRPIEGSTSEPEPLRDDQLPGLFISILPILLPVILISANTITKTLADAEHAAQFKTDDIVWTDFSSQLATEGAYVMGLMPAETQESVRKIAEGGGADVADVQEALNGLLQRKDLYTPEAFAGVELPTEAVKLKAKGFARTSQATVEHFNRLVLEAAFGDSIKPHLWETPRRKAASITALIGDPNLAMLISAAIALIVLHRQRKPSLKELSKIVETALMSAGVIILITSGGGAFGAMLQQAQIGPAIEGLFAGEGVAGIAGVKLLFMGFFVACLLKFAQGSSTVSMITASAMMASLLIDPVSGKFADIGFHPVYLAAVIGFGAQCCNWMNDSGFWIFAKMGGLTELETLKTWTVTVSLLAVVGLLVTVAFAKVLPLV